MRNGRRTRGIEAAPAPSRSSRRIGRGARAAGALAGGAAALGLGVRSHAWALPAPSAQHGAPSTQLEAHSTRELLVIDGRMARIAELVRGARPSVDVLVLDPQRDGIAQITEALASRRGVAAVHLFAHGAPGSVVLGSTDLDTRTVATRAGELRAWFGAAAPFERRPDLLVYGCSAGAGAKGARFVTALSAATGADVAASDDLTGSAALGADFALEVSAGAIEAELPLAESVLSGYPQTLDTLVVTSAADSGPGSLRQAILDANADPDHDTIVFAFEGECPPGGPLADAGLCTSDGGLMQPMGDGGGLAPLQVTLVSGALTITEPVAILGPGAERLAIDGNDSDRVFYVRNGEDVLIDGLTIQNGKTQDVKGGGNVLVRNTAFTLSNAVVQDGYARNRGGALSVYGSASDATIVDVLIRDNGSGTDGGAIAFLRGGSGALQRTTVSGNDAYFNGGALYLSFQSVVEIRDSLIAGNSGEEGGAIAAYEGGWLEITNSTLSGNVADERGGAILIGDDSVAVVESSTITANITSADSEGAGVFCGTGLFTAVSSILHGNTLGDPGGPGALASDLVSGSTGTVVASASLLGAIGGQVGDVGGAPNLVGVDPLLMPLADNGGPTRTHALAEGSPALDVGTNPESLLYDQRGEGFARVSGDGPDIGAFELQVKGSSTMDGGTGTGGGTGGVGGGTGGAGGGTGGDVGGGAGGGTGGSSGDGCGCAVIGAESSSAPTGLNALWLGLLGALGWRRRARRASGD